MEQNFAKTIERAAMLYAYGVQDQHIADACGISMEQLDNIRATKEFRQATAEQAAEEFDKSKDLNDAWDQIEAKALGTILETLQYNKNTDLAVKLAVFANRANRRAGFHPKNQTINGAGNGTTAVVINLNQRFVNNRPQIMVDEGQLSVKDMPSKQVDVMPPGQVKRLLDKREANILDGADYTEITDSDFHSAMGKVFG